MNLLIEIVDKISVEKVTDFVSSPSCGAINIFVGTVRDNHYDKQVVKLYFEVYESMAIKELTKLSQEAMQKYQLQKVAIQHVRGAKQVSEQVIAIAVSAPHREYVFEATSFLISEIKKSVPIWKKEYYLDGSEEWVNSERVY